MTTLGTRILTWLRGELVGTDAYGNRYYRLKGDKPSRRGGGRFSRERRWVIYQGEPEGSKVPLGMACLAASHGRRAAGRSAPALPLGKAAPAEPDRAPRRPIIRAGSVLRGGHRARATGDYEPWSPE